MHQLNINRQDGGIPKTLPGEDHISGLIAYLNGGQCSREAYNLFGKPQLLTSLETAEKLGITPYTDGGQHTEGYFLHYHLSEIFRTNPACRLYLLLVENPDEFENYDPVEIFQLQQYADGSIRQMGIWVPHFSIADDFSGYNIAENINSQAELCDTDLHAPLSVILAASCDDITALPLSDIHKKDLKRLSILFGESADTDVQALKTATQLKSPDFGITCIGTTLGMLSRAKVHQSISWVKEFPTDIYVPAFTDGTLYREQDTDMIAGISQDGAIFLRTYPGQAGSYFNDSRTMGDPAGDYNTIEAVRTMDKAVRSIRTYLTPELGGNIYIDAETGKMQSYSVSHLETTANHALEDMERAGELSGYKVEIDPEQDVLSTSTVEIVIKQVPVGVMRKINVKIGFTKKV